MRNFDISPDSLRRSDLAEHNSEVRWEESDSGGGEKGIGGGVELRAVELERMNLQKFRDLTPEASKYIEQLELELSTAKEELRARKLENLQMEHIKKSNNNLLEYLRSLESDMVTELSRPSSPEVEEIIPNLLKIYCGDFSKKSWPLIARVTWLCMLLGHHLRGLENRLHLSCVVGLFTSGNPNDLKI
ncbi:hypothetical protein Sango_1775500 [Sesamum angolense]|uniref:Uncharacterized protein n=1 Tax=Sesamum angolense TaxID=2727404 RepID=A0AAE2BPJ3_9LAMI|nr:hypothetical protein Sango_1775500 [Sesamum angolense]